MAASQTKTPAALGFRMPAEWEPQAAVWLSWPHKYASWPGQFRPVPYTFARIVARAMTLAGALDNSPMAWSEIDAYAAYELLGE